MNRYTATIFLLLGIFPAAFSCGWSAMDLLMKGKKLIGKDYAPAFDMPQKESDKSIFASHPDVAKEIRQMGTGQTLVSNIKLSWLMLDLPAAFLRALDLSPSYSVSHHLDYRIYELHLATKHLLRLLYESEMEIGAKAFVCYNYESESFGGFKSAVSNAITTLRAVIELKQKSRKDLRQVKPLVILLQHLEAVSMVLFKHIQEVRGHFNEKTPFYKWADTYREDPAFSSEGKNAIRTFKNTFNFSFRMLDMRVPVYDKAFYAPVQAMMDVVRRGILATNSEDYRKDVTLVVDSLGSFLESGFTERSLLHQDFDAFFKPSFDALLKNMAQIATLRQSRLAQPDIGKHYSLLLKQFTALSGALTDAFVNYRNKWVVYRGALKERSYKEPQPQMEYIKKIALDLYEGESPYFRTINSELAPVLASIHNNAVHLLEHVQQPAPVTEVLDQLHQHGRTMLEKGELVHFPVNGAQAVGAIEYPLDVCRSFFRHMWSNLNPGFYKQLTSGGNKDFEFPLKQIISQSGALGMIWKNRFALTDHVCLELKHGMFDWNTYSSFKAAEAKKKQDQKEAEGLKTFKDFLAAHPEGFAALLKLPGHENKINPGQGQIEGQVPTANDLGQIQKQDVKEGQDEGQKFEDENQKDKISDPQEKKESDEVIWTPLPQIEDQLADELPKVPFRRFNSLPVPNTQSKEEENKSKDDLVAERRDNGLPISGPSDADTHVLTDVNEETPKRVKKVTRVFVVEVVKCPDCVQDPLLLKTINEVRATKSE